MKIAFYNIENLFFRHSSLLNNSHNHCVKQWKEELDTLMYSMTNSQARYDRIQELVYLLGFEHRDPLRFGYLNQRGMIMAMKPRNFKLASPAGSSNGWRGWIEIENRPIPELAIRNKAQLMAEINADIWVLQEVENKMAVQRFLDDILSNYPVRSAYNLTVASGNDERGVDQALLLGHGIILSSLGIYNQERDSNGDLVFDRDFSVFNLSTKSGDIWILAAQFSLEPGPKEALDKRRFLQSKRLAKEYHRLRNLGIENIIVMGSFFTVSYNYSLSPLLRETDLKSIISHHEFRSARDHGRDSDYYSLGAYAKGLNIQQEVYFLVSPNLFSRIKKCGLDRRGIWPHKDQQWKVLNSLQEKKNQASKHPILWIDLD